MPRVLSATTSIVIYILTKTNLGLVTWILSEHVVHQIQKLLIFSILITNPLWLMKKVISLTLIIARVNAYRTHGCSLSGLDKIALTFNCQWLILALASEGVIGCCPMKIYVNLTEIPSKKWGIN